MTGVISGSSRESEIASTNSCEGWSIALQADNISAADINKRNKSFLFIYGIIISNKLHFLDNKAINDISEIDQCTVKYN